MYNAFYYRTVGNVTAPIEEDDNCDHVAEKEGEYDSSAVDALSVGSSASRPSTPSQTVKNGMAGSIIGCANI